LLVELRKRGDRALLHGLRGRPSNRRLAARLELKIFAPHAPTLWHSAQWPGPSTR
jgi:hypothetical protein